MAQSFIIVNIAAAGNDAEPMRTVVDADIAVGKLGVFHIVVHFLEANITIQ